MSESEIGANVSGQLEQVTSTDNLIPEKFGNDVSKLVESYKHLESKLGTMYSVPTSDSAPEKWQDFESKVISTGKFIPRPTDNNKDEFYKQLGRPEKPEAYSLDLPQEAVADQAFLQRIAAKAFETGVTNNQLKELTHTFMQYEQEKFQHLHEGKAQAEASLKAQWGADYENRLAGAKAAINVYKAKYPEAITELVNSATGNNPAFIAMLSELGQSLRESGHAGAVSTPQYGMTADSAKDKIREIMDNRSHPYFDDTNPGHSEAVDKVKKLYSIAYSE
jgi:hypothetical protein